MWNTAFLEQARSDWEAFRVLRNSSYLPACHSLHYLQMTAEKLGKAVLLTAGADVVRIKGSHKAFVKLLQISSRNSKLGGVMGMKSAQLRSHLLSLVQLAFEIEILAPALSNTGPNVEYPWERGGNVVIPAKHAFKVEAFLAQQKGRNLLKLVNLMLIRFDDVFS